jgi:hypothetical protein
MNNTCISWGMDNHEILSIKKFLCSSDQFIKSLCFALEGIEYNHSKYYIFLSPVGSMSFATPLMWSRQKTFGTHLMCKYFCHHAARSYWKVLLVLFVIVFPSFQYSSFLVCQNTCIFISNAVRTSAHTPCTRSLYHCGKREKLKCFRVT